jgi:hypothetical protein
MGRAKFALLGGAALSMLAPVSAVHAAAFIIDDTLPTDNIVFSANDFEGGLFLDGTLFQQGTNNPAVATLPEGDANHNPFVHTFDGQWITQGAPLPPSPLQVAFIEPLTGTLSTNWPETNGPFNFSAPFLTATANSDVEVPEPVSCGLFAIGLGALLRRRHA